MDEQKFYDYFQGVFGGLYRLDIRLDGVFSSAEIKSSLEENSEVSLTDIYYGEVAKEVSSVPKLIISITTALTDAPSFSNDPKMVYMSENYFFRMYTNNCLKTLKRNVILGTRKKELLGIWNLFVDTSSIRTTLSLEGAKSLTGKMFWSGVIGTKGSIRPIDRVEINKG